MKLVRLEFTKSFNFAGQVMHCWPSDKHKGCAAEPRKGGGYRVRYKSFVGDIPESFAIAIYREEEPAKAPAPKEDKAA